MTEELKISTQNYEHPVEELNTVFPVFVTHIYVLEKIKEKVKRDPQHIYCRFFYDTLHDILMHG